MSGLPIFVFKSITSEWKRNFQPKNSHKVPHPETNSADTYLPVYVILSQRQNIPYMYIIKCVRKKIHAQKGGFMKLLQNEFKHWGSIGIWELKTLLW